MLMRNWRGFTLIEVLTTMTILGIVATIAAPEYWRMQSRDNFRSEGQALFDTFLYARNAALTNKRCSGGENAVRWMVLVDTDADPINYELRCYRDDTNFVVEEASVAMTKTNLKSLDFNEAEAPAAMTGQTGALFADSMQVSFFTGGVNVRLDYDDGSLNKATSFQMLLGHTESAYEHTLCLNRIAGFPTFNKSGNTCQSY